MIIFSLKGDNQIFYFIIYDVLRNLVPFVQFKKREKHQWRSVTFIATLLKVAVLRGCFSRFLNCTNGTKSGNASYIFNQFRHLKSTCMLQ